MTAMHFVVKSGTIVPINFEAFIFESGDWVIAKKKADQLIGAKFYAHQNQSRPAFFGGEIVGYREVGGGRIAIQFHAIPEYRGVTPPRSGWKREQATVWETEVPQEPEL